MLRVVSFGTLVADSRFFRQHVGGVVPYPVGYTVERNVFRDKDSARTKVVLPSDAEDGDDGGGGHARVSDVHYTATITQASDGSPLFEVARSDKPEVVHAADNPSTAWRGAFEAAVRDFPRREEELCKDGRDKNGIMTVHGQKWYGLTLERVLDGLKKLHGANAILQGGKSTRRSSKVGKRSRSGSVASPSPPPPPPPAAAATTAGARKTARGSRSKASVVSSQQTIVEEDASAPAKKRRTTTKASSTKVDDDDVPPQLPPSLNTLKAEGSCPDCGLMTTFCHVTGRPHEQDGKPRRGASTRVTAPKKAGQAAKNTSEVRAAQKKSQPQKSQKRSNTRAARGGDAESPDEAEDDVGKTRKQRGASRGKAPSPQAPRRGKNQRQEEKSRSSSLDSDDVPLAARCMNEALTPAPQLLRPPLAAPESQKALQTLQRLIRSEEVIHSPFLSMLHLPLIPAARARTATRKTEGGTDSDQNGGDEEDEEEDRAGSAAHDVTGSAASPTCGTKTGKKKKHDEEKMRHPLSITDVSASVAGRRYVKFMQLYTSERAKMDLLKKAGSVPAVPRSRGGVKKNGTKVVVSKHPPDDAESDAEA